MYLCQWYRQRAVSWVHQLQQMLRFGWTGQKVVWIWMLAVGQEQEVLCMSWLPPYEHFCVLRWDTCLQHSAPTEGGDELREEEQLVSLMAVTSSNDAFNTYIVKERQASYMHYCNGIVWMTHSGFKGRQKHCCAPPPSATLVAMIKLIKAHTHSLSSKHIIHVYISTSTPWVHTHTCIHTCTHMLLHVTTKQTIVLSLFVCVWTALFGSYYMR